MSLHNFSIIESTLREGEQFVNAFFTPAQKERIARQLDEFGVEYLEMTTPAASPQSESDCRMVAGLGLRARTLTHTRCTLEDARRAVDTGVNGVDVVIGTSSQLRQFSHGKSIDEIIAGRKWAFCSRGCGDRFSTRRRQHPGDIYRDMGVDKWVFIAVGVGPIRSALASGDL